MGDIANILTGGEAPEDTIKSDQPDGDYKYPVLSNGLGENALWGYAKTYRVKAPAITFSSIGTLGYPELRNTDFTPIIRLKVIIPKNNNLNISFLKNSISLADFSNNASGIPNINAESVKSISLKISLNQTEQEHIGNLFDNLDYLITLHQRKCKIWIIFSKTDRILIRGSKMDYKSLVKEYREQQLLTQAELAKKLNVGIADISRWENGKYEPTMKIKRVLKSLFIESGLIKGETNNE